MQTNKMAPFDQLMDAIKNNNNGKVSELLERLDVETVNKTDCIGYSPLHQACGSNNRHAATAFLAMDGIQLNTRSNFGNTPILVAAWNSNVEVLRIMIEDPRVDIDARDGDGRALEEIVGSYSGSEERKNTCLQIIREERRKRENPGMRQNANEESMEATFRREYLEQIEKVKLEVEESKQRQRENIKLGKAKIKSLSEKRELEKKTSNMKSDQEILKLENKKLTLEQEMRTVQQTLDKEKQKKKTREEEINQKYEKEKATLEQKIENERKEDRTTLTTLEEMISQLNKNLSELNVKPENSAATKLEAASDTLECPVCLETMKPPTRIWMCPASHLVCELCQQRLEGRRCPTCRTAQVTLRAFMAENFARTIFNE